MTIKDIKINGNIIEFNFTNKGFTFVYMDDGVQKQYGSTAKSEMSQFAEILKTELRPAEGTVEVS